MRHATALLILVLAPVVAATSSGAGASPAAESTVVVTTEAQYRTALTELSADDSGPHTIQFGGDIQLTLQDGDPIYTGTQPLTLDGQGHRLRGVTDVGLLDYRSPEPLTVQDLTFAHASSGIVSGGSVVVQRSRFVDLRLRTTHGVGGSHAIYAHRGNDIIPVVFVTDSTFLRNSTPAGGGAISSNGRVVVDRSTFRRNTAHDATAIRATGDVRITRSTLVGNHARKGTTISSNQGSVSLVNSTLTGNLADDLQVGQDAVVQADRVDLVYVTIAGNVGQPAVDADTLRSRRSLVDNATRACHVGDVPVAVASRSSDRSCAFRGPHHGVLDDPRLGPLADNGGPTLTRKPMADSALIDAADCGAGVQTDQRGLHRPARTRCDIGAVEVH